jgi:periplasmic divalent cation tolerance protein
MSYILVFMTASSKNEAKKIVLTLLKEKLIACANIIDSVTSIFLWQEKIENEKEVLVIMKSHQNLFSEVSARVKELHSYNTAEILALPIVKGSKEYLEWLKKVLNR